MERRHIPEMENKLVILYAMSKLGPVTDLQLIQFLAEMDLMNYFTMQLSLGEMDDQGQIARHPHPLGELLLPSEEGLFTLRSFSGRIPRSRRSRIDKNAASWHDRFRTEQMAPAEILSRTEESLTIRLRLLEGSSALMDLTMAGSDISDAYLERRWQMAAQTVYRTAIAALTEGFSPDVTLPHDAQPALQQLGCAEWLLTLPEDPAAPGFALLLTLPDERMARYALHRWPSCAATLRETVVSALRSAPV